MMKANPFLWGLCLFTVLLGLLTLYQIKQLTNGHASMVQTREELNQAQLDYSELQALASEGETLTERNRELNAALPALVNENSLINDLNAFLLTLGGDLRGLQLDLEKMENQDGITSIPMNIEVTTDYNGLLKIMDYLQHGPRAMQVNSFTIHRIDDLIPHELLVGVKVTIFAIEP